MPHAIAARRFWSRRSRNWFVSDSSFDGLAKVHPCPEPLDQFEELVRSFASSIGLVLAVPATTAIAVATVPGPRDPLGF